jgi:hypothetical protein
VTDLLANLANPGGGIRFSRGNSNPIGGAKSAMGIDRRKAGAIAAQHNVLVS